MDGKKQSILGSLPKGVFQNLCVGLLALILGAIFGGPKMAITQESAFIVFLCFLAVYLGITFWSVFSLLPKIIAGQLQTEGPYKFVRHPMYGAIIFILNPALAILFRSWLLALACLLAYLIWRKAAQSEEKELIEKFGDEYSKYKKFAWPLFPNLFKINKPFFFILNGVLVFAFSFIVLNLPSFYLRDVEWQQKEETPVVAKQIETGTNAAQLPENQSVRPKPRYDKTNSIVIGKINIDAPLVFAAGTTQKELNAALNQGVVIYPGSALPGEPGNLFLTGHSSTFFWNKTQYGQVFTLLDKLEAGDTVTVYYEQYKYDYQITRKYVTTPDKAVITAQNSGQTITLLTCWPIGTSLKRLIVEGVQIQP